MIRIQSNRKYLGRGPIAQTLPRPIIQQPLGPVNLRIRHPRKIRPLRKELPIEYWESRWSLVQWGGQENRI